MCSCLRGFPGDVPPLACGSGSPELSKSFIDMASKSFTFTFTSQGNQKEWSDTSEGLARDWIRSREDKRHSTLTFCNMQEHWKEDGRVLEGQHPSAVKPDSVMLKKASLLS